MKSMTFLIKPASSSCNYNCRYCFYYDVADNREIANYGIISRETIDKIISKALNQFDEETEINFAFQGGEPTMAGIETFYYFTDKVNELKKNHHHINYSIQTNGWLIDEKWIALFKEYNFLVGVSLDGFKENHDYFRQINKKPTFDKVYSSINLLENNNIEYNILTVLTNKLAESPEELFNFYKDNKFRYVQIIPCMPKAGMEYDEYSLQPEMFYSFYKTFFDLWLEEYNSGNYISISLINDILNILNHRMPGTCGALGKCSAQFIIEADGGVYPCDFYVLDQYLLGNINNDSIDDIISSNNVSLFLERKKRTSPLCNQCKYINICGGQCARLNVCYFNDEYCGYQKLLEYIINKLR